jgi:ubiquinone/menaquinone biosynthesis C-methylase UbiE
VGGQICRAAEAALGKPMTTTPLLHHAAAYRLWSATYDSDPNPVLALERRVLEERLIVTHVTRVLDLATGTGRWLEYATAKGASGFGVDLSPEMLARAAEKGFAGRLVRATLSALPFPNDVADLAICSFALGYLRSPAAAFREMGRTCQRVIVSDLHPEAVRAGWVRSFRTGDGNWEIISHHHSRELLHHCAKAAGLRPAWQREAPFGEPERSIFEQAGKSAAFEAARQVPAILVSCWTRA